MESVSILLSFYLSAFFLISGIIHVKVSTKRRYKCELWQWFFDPVLNLCVLIGLERMTELKPVRFVAQEYVFRLLRNCSNAASYFCWRNSYYKGLFFCWFLLLSSRLCGNSEKRAWGWSPLPSVLAVGTSILFLPGSAWCLQSLLAIGDEPRVTRPLVAQILSCWFSIPLQISMLWVFWDLLQPNAKVEVFT